MTDLTREKGLAMGESVDQSSKVIDKIFAAAQPGATFGEPVVSGAYTVITASEVMAGGGFGYGRGFGPARPAGAAATGEAGETSVAAGGSGGGGGGGSSARPVAVVVIGPNGVTVKPVIDATKLTIAGVTAIAAMLAAARRFRRLRKN